MGVLIIYTFRSKNFILKRDKLTYAVFFLIESLYSALKIFSG